MATARIRQLCAEVRARFPAPVDPLCFCLDCRVADCLVCYLDMAPDPGEADFGDGEPTVIEPPLWAVRSVAAYLLWDQLLDPRIPRHLNSRGRPLGDSKAYLTFKF